MTTRSTASPAFVRVSRNLIAALRATPAVQRVLASIITADLQRHCGTAGAANLELWTGLWHLLSICALDLRAARDPRTADWRQQAYAAHQVVEAMRSVLVSRRPGGGITHAEPMPRSWQPSGQVIDVEGMVMS